ncbi:MAG: TRAP transporter small permease [Desulfobacterales bacterium]|nr:MAG: TRAP transporter small permease [Desulfobacterales bacterium]
MARWARVDAIISRVEQLLIVVCLSLMILVAFAQIVLRNFFATGFSWGDSLIRYLVVWVGFIGAAVATKEGKHISIDVFSRWVTGRGRIAIQFVAQLFSALICGLLTYAALKFVRNEAEMGSLIFLGIPAWIPQLVIPVTFGLITLRFCLRSGRDFAQLWQTDAQRVNERER